jgi:hypothetical protein
VAVMELSLDLDIVCCHQYLGKTWLQSNIRFLMHYSNAKLITTLAPSCPLSYNKPLSVRHMYKYNVIYLPIGV